MKIWVTRLSTGELHSGGLERCRVWFQKPIFVQSVTVDELNDLPFGENELRGLGHFGWVGGMDSHYPSDSISFGKLFGYGHKSRHENHINELSEWVWKKLNDHYGDTRFPEGWYEYEKQGKCHQSQFLLEIELNITSFL